LKSDFEPVTVLIDYEWLDAINWNKDGLIPVITQDKRSGKVLMQAWMNREALALTASEGRAVYWSRSREKIWCKGEESGNIQIIEELRTDCDKDSILLLVTQQGSIACHTGRKSCFFEKYNGQMWETVDPVIRSINDIHHK